MHWNRFLPVALAILAAALQAQTTSAGLFTLIDYPDATSTQIWAINARREMIGVYVSADRVTHGFLFTKDRFTSIDFPGAALTLANGINDRGDIVGEYAMTPTGPHKGFLLSGGRFTTIDHPSGTSNGVVGIAANGDMVGFYGSPLRGYLLKGDKFSALDYPGASPTVLGSISPQGEVVGSFAANGVSRAFLYRKEFTVWDYPGSAGFTNAIGRNAAGDTVGRYRDSANVSHGYLLSGGEFTSFDCPGATFTGAAGITPDGDIVGRCTVGGVSRGFLLARGQQSRYEVTDVGTFGGPAALAFGLNNAGTVGGSATVANGDTHPFLWRDGKLTDLGTLGGPNGAAQNPNGSLTVPVLSELSKPDPFGADFCGYDTRRSCAAALWQSGKLTPVAGLGGNNSIGFGINERGQMVGTAEKNTPDPACVTPRRLATVPVVWAADGKSVRELRLPKGDSSGWAYNINDKGDIVGSTGSCANTIVSVLTLSGKRAVLWQAGVPRDLGGFGGDGDNLAVGINNRTEVVGASSAPDGTTHGFLWSLETGMTDIGSVGNDVLGAPSSVNASGRVVGGSCDADFNCRAFVWDRGTMSDLNDLIPADSPIYLAFATWINDVGEIAGYAVDKQTQQLRAFLARPARAASAVAAVEQSRPMTLPVRVREKMKQHVPTGKKTGGR